MYILFLVLFCCPVFSLDYYIYPEMSFGHKVPKKARKTYKVQSQLDKLIDQYVSVNEKIKLWRPQPNLKKTSNKLWNKVNNINFVQKKEKNPFKYYIYVPFKEVTRFYKKINKEGKNPIRRADIVLEFHEKLKKKRTEKPDLICESDMEEEESFVYSQEVPVEEPIITDNSIYYNYGCEQNNESLDFIVSKHFAPIINASNEIKKTNQESIIYKKYQQNFEQKKYFFYTSTYVNVHKKIAQQKQIPPRLRIIFPKKHFGKIRNKQKHFFSKDLNEDITQHYRIDLPLRIIHNRKNKI